MNESDYIALGTLKTSIRNQIWSGHEAENLVTQHDLMFLEGLAEIQKFIPCEQINNVNVLPFCKTYFKCGLTVFPAPRGIIRRIYTIEDDWCDPILYYERGWPAPECWAKSITDVPVPLTAGLGNLPLGFEVADESTDVTCGRALCGIWSKHERNIYLAPWIQSTESVVIEWDGIKPGADWTDSDLVNGATDFRKALKLYVQYAHERDYGSDLAQKIALRRDYDEAFGDLLWQCNEELKVRKTTGCMRRCATPGELLMDGITPPATPLAIAIGEADIDPGSSDLPLVTVDLTSHSLPSVPRAISVRVVSPTAASDTFSCTLISGWTKDSFQVRLDGVPETNGYKLAYELI